MSGQGHDGKGQSDSGRRSKPAVASKQTHPALILWEPIWDSEELGE